MRTPEGRTDAFKFLLPAVQKLPDRLERAAVASDLASYLGVEASLVLDQFRRAATDRKTQVVAPAKAASLPPTERLLLRAVVLSPVIRQEILPLLGTHLTAEFQSREIFDALRSSDAENSVSFSGIEGRLTDAGKVLLHGALAADDIEDEDVLRDQAQACLRRLELDWQSQYVADLTAKITKAEREGHMQEALKWIEELAATSRRTEMDRDSRTLVGVKQQRRSLGIAPGLRKT